MNLLPPLPNFDLSIIILIMNIFPEKVAAVKAVPRQHYATAASPCSVLSSSSSFSPLLRTGNEETFHYNTASMGIPAQVSPNAGRRTHDRPLRLSLTR